MLIKHIFVSVAVVLIIVLGGGYAHGMNSAKELILIEGVGAPGFIMLGESKDDIAAKRIKSLKIKYRIEVDFIGDIALFVICSKKLVCVTDRNVAVGDSVGLIFKAYGKPEHDAKDSNKNYFLYNYNGIAFKVKKDKVTDIIIYPAKTLRKKQAQ